MSFENLKSIGHSFVIVHRILVASLLLIPLHPDASAAGWKLDRGKGYTICEAIFNRINQFNYPDPIKEPNNCAWNAMLSLRDFTDPPWEDLNPAENSKLIYNLIKHSWSNGEPEKVKASQEPFVQSDIAEFINNGGRVQLWHTRLVSNFYNDNHPESWTPPDPQNVIQLRYAIPVASKTLDAKVCPSIPQPGWFGRTYIANDDLSAIHPDTGRALDLYVMGTLVLYKRNPFFLHRMGALELAVSRDTRSGPSELGSYSYTHPS
jgi:hypothetical protein